MATLLLDPRMERELLEQRRAWGADRYDEVWEGVYRMAPLTNDEQQDLVMELAGIFREILGSTGRASIRPGVNVSDRTDDWTKNFRCPDVVVFLRGTSAKNFGEFWFGGPDFLVEVVSPGDDTREKIPFHARIGTREMLIVERDPWAIELLLLDGDALVSVGSSNVANRQLLTSQVIPFQFRLVAGEARPKIEVTSMETGKMWSV